MVKVIKGYELLYSINELGEVYNINTDKILKSTFDGRYMIVMLCKDKKYQKKYLHKLLCEAFKDNPEGYKCINHIDGVKTNNNLNNLEWCTHGMNLKHAYDTGLKRKGKEHCFHLNNKSSIKIKNTLTGEIYNSIKEAAKAIGYHEGSLARALRENKSSHLNVEYLDNYTPKKRVKRSFFHSKKAFFNESQIRDIRELLKTKKPFEIAKIYNVDKQIIYYIRKGKTYKNVI